MSYENSVFRRDMTCVEMWNRWKRLFFNSLRVEADSATWNPNVFNSLRWRAPCGLWPTARKNL